MNISRKDFAAYVKDFDFKGLFNYLGWDYVYNTLPPIEIKGHTYDFEIVAVKSGFSIIICTADNGTIPVYSIRSQIDNNIKKLLHEHIIIFQDKARGQQAWLYSYAISGKAKKTEIIYNTNQDPERLYERAAGLIFDIDEEDKITILDVTNRVNANFAVNAEKVTKKFYDGFKKQHSNLLKFIQGIDSTVDREWYSSIMLNRLMFCYFMQKRGFLNRDRNYLRNKLLESKAKLGTNQFYSFYRNFLLVLFHKGFGSHKHTPEVVEMIGDIPYLNGGLFEVHEIEQRCPEIEINDSAFEAIFDLFDQYEWHLDSRECASGNEISPDVLGYIFEKYINDRAKMGAYYTQEDITEYISRNSIIPFIFNKAEEKYQAIFAPEREIATLLKNSGDKYIFESVKKGVDKELPDYIAVGLNTEEPNLLERRAPWNESAPSEYGLPTEIWRETIDRRQRYFDACSKIKSGEISSIQDFITYNLDICAFAQDVVDTIDDPQLIRVIYEIISKITVLDPTCGSGAFLFAALNILEPLYSSCLSRMEDFLNTGANLPKTTRRLFEDELENMGKHPNKAYFIYKSIILNNLYGVDIMKEATETAKLRLFLKLVSTANPNYGKENIGIEPLPDIDFNIKCGNTLVGYATEAEVENALTGNMLSMMMTGEVRESILKLSMATHRYKQLQLAGGESYEQFKESKDALKSRRKSVNEILDRTLYEEVRELKPLDRWLADTQPFHWISEFYDIISAEDGNGGFDIVIGNPPYIAKGKIQYKLQDNSFSAPDLYGYVINRSLNLLNNNGMHGFIVMHNIAFSNQFNQTRKLLRDKSAYCYFSFFARIPAGLFSGDVRVRNCIYIIKKDSQCPIKQFFTTRMHRWFSESRAYLFDKLQYVPFELEEVIPMYFSILEKDLFANLRRFYQVRFLVDRNSQNKLYFKQSAYNWVSVTKKPAPCFESSGEEIDQSQVKAICFKKKEILDDLMLLYDGKLFFAYWLTFGDEFHVTKDDILSMDYPLDALTAEDKSQLSKISNEFNEDLDGVIQYKLNAGKRVGNYNMSKLWDLTTQSDMIFLNRICDRPEIYYDSIISHVRFTVISQNSSEDEEE